MGWGQDPQQQRALLELSFEPSGAGYIYYHWRWSRGIPVSAAERDAYLRIPALGSRRAWRKSIAGRPTVPPRDYKPVRAKMVRTMPWATGPLCALLGLLALIRGLEARTWLGRANFILTALLLIVAIQFLIDRIRADGSSPPE